MNVTECACVSVCVYVLVYVLGHILHIHKLKVCSSVSQQPQLLDIRMADTWYSTTNKRQSGACTLQSVHSFDLCQLRSMHIQ